MKKLIIVLLLSNYAIGNACIIPVLAGTALSVTGITLNKINQKPDCNVQYYDAHNQLHCVHY